MGTLSGFSRSGALGQGKRERTDPFEGVVVLSPFFWNFHDDMWQTTHHIAREFARYLPTVFVEPSDVWNFRSAGFRIHGLFRSLFGSRIGSPQPNLTVFHRGGLPLGRSKLVRDFDLARNARSLRELLSSFGFRRTLLWHSFPYWSERLADAVGPTLFVYHCLDHSTREEEVRLIRRADAVFCVSETLVAKHKPVNPHTYLLPNGVDLSLFDCKRAAEGPRPSDLPTNGRLLGFLGYVNYHLDIELLLQVAKAFPEDHLIIVGRIPTRETAPQGKQKEALARLRSQPNVRILGFKPTEQLPMYLHAFDVCLIPFLRNPFNRECDPLKFYQYVAMGKPVVSTPVVVAERYREICYLAGSPEEFVAQVTRALREGVSEALRQARLAVAGRHSWSALLQGVWKALGELI